MASRSPIVRFLIVSGVLLILIVGGIVAVWELIWNAPESPGPSTASVVTTQPAQPTTSSVGSIGGIVEDESKAPIKGVKIRVGWQETPTNPNARAAYHTKSATTNDQGKWNLSGIKPDSVSSVSLGLTHKDYAQKDVYDSSISQLTDHSLVIVLTHGVDVTGQIVDAAGAGIGGATVTTKRSRYDSRGVTAKSAGDGGFTLHHIPASDINLVVTAKDFGPRQFQPVPNQPAKIVMSRGQTIHGRVIDPQGNPIKGVELQLQQWRSTYQAVDLHVSTDADGKFEIPHAPSDPMTFNVGKAGFQDVDLSLNPGDPPPTVKLVPSVVFIGNVVDADTGKPIPTFNAFPGALWPGWTGAIFNLDPRPEHTFHDGVYNLQANGFGGTILAWYVRIEADGYYPQTGNPVRNGGKIPQDFQLHRGPAVHGILVDADGKPVPNIQVILLLPCSSANVSNGEYRDSNLGTQGVTDAQGAFHLRPQSGPFELWAMTKSGVAEVRLNRSDDKPIALKLIPWASIHVHAATMPSSPDDSPRFSITPGPDPNDPLNFSHWNYSTSPLPNGDAVFDRLPVVGDGTTSAYLSMPNSLSRSMVIHLSPGKTSDIDLTGGVTVIGRFAAENSGDHTSTAQASINLQRLPDGPPSQWPAGWASAAKAGPYTYGYWAQADRDGEFTLAGIAPGKYEYSSFLAYGSGTVAAGIITVPEPTGDHPSFDVGSIQYATRKPLAVGDPAPETLGRTLADQPIRLADFSGKYVVWFFWGDGFGGAHSDNPAIAALASQFAADKRVALVAINSDRARGNNRPLEPPAILPGNAWTNGYVSLVDLPLLTSLNSFKEGEYPQFYIITPDGKIAAMNIPADQIPAKLNELLRTPH
jgi:hypothetical protein